MKRFIKKNTKLIVGIIVGLILSSVTVYAATIIYQSNQVGYDNTNTGLQLNNADVDNVQDAIEALYEKVPKKCTTSPFHLGDYVDFTPTSTSYSPDTTLRGNATAVTLNPSELSTWRVIKINPDCTVEVVSEYVSTNTVQFNGKVGYQNYVYMLNEIAKQYANTTYTLDPTTAPDGAFRNVGYDHQTKQLVDSSDGGLSDTALGTSGHAGFQTNLPDEEKGGGDTGFGKDMTLLEAARVNLRAYKAPNTTTFTNYWLASRIFNWYNTSIWGFSARYVYDIGSINGASLYYWNGSRFDEDGSAYSVRPIVTLKSGLTPTYGDGTSSNHFRWTS